MSWKPGNHSRIWATIDNFNALSTVGCGSLLVGRLSVQATQSASTGARRQTLVWNLQGTRQLPAENQKATLVCSLDPNQLVTEYFYDYGWSELAAATFASVNISILVVAVLFPKVIAVKQRREFLFSSSAASNSSALAQPLNM